MNAIDFKQLRRLEKQRFRKELLLEEKEQEKLHQGNSTTIPTSSNTSPDAKAASSTLHIATDSSSSSASTTSSNACHSQFQVSENCTHVNLTDILEQSRIISIHHEENSTDNYDTANAKKSPSNVYYIQHFLSAEYTNDLMEWLHQLPHASNTDTEHTRTRTRTNQDHCNGKWTRLKFSQRNVALIDFGCYASFNTDGTSAPFIPPLLQKLSQILVDIKAFPPSHPPNHVLINDYQGHEGILPHTDGPIYLDRTATLSIAGGDVLFHFTERNRDNDNDNDGNGNGNKNNDKGSSVMQVKLHGNGSLVVFTNDAYTNHCHSIHDRIHNLVEYAGTNCANAPTGEAVRRGHRMSLTFRHKLSSPCRLMEEINY
eukprot:scaffold12081_cov308-Chaetoceros_neogracile.AAC.2